MNVPTVIGNYEIIRVNAFRVSGRALEKVRSGDALELDDRLIGFVDGMDFDFYGVGEERASDQASTIAQRMQPQ